MIKIAIIDDGINSYEYNILNVQENIIIDADGKVCRNVPADNMAVKNSHHGSVCAAIISKYCKNVVFINVVMEAKTVGGAISATSLYSALELCLSLNLDLINISAGIIDVGCYYDFLGLINRLYQNGTITVAASSTDEKMTIPACYSNVVGVLYSESVEKNNYRINNDLVCRANYLVNNTEIIRLHDGKICCFGGCSSFAAPLICSEIANNILDDGEKTLSKVLHNKLEPCYDWLESPVIYILSAECMCVHEERIIFENFTLEIISCSDFSDGMCIIKNKIHSVPNDRDIAIFSNGIYTNGFTISDSEFIERNIAVFVDNVTLSEDLLRKKQSRVFLLSHSLNKVLSRKYTFSVDINSVECSTDRELVQIIEKSSDDTLIFSVSSHHMLYGIEYIPINIVEELDLLNAYVTKLAYTLNKKKAVVLL